MLELESVINVGSPRTKGELPTIIFRIPPYCCTEVGEIGGAVAVGLGVVAPGVVGGADVGREVVIVGLTLVVGGVVVVGVDGVPHAASTRLADTKGHDQEIETFLHCFSPFLFLIC